MMNHIIYAAIGFVAGAITGGIVIGKVLTKEFTKKIDDLDKQNQNLTDELVRIRDEDFKEREEKIEKQEAKLTEYKTISSNYIPLSDDDDDECYDELVFHSNSGDTVVKRIEVEDRSEDIKRIDEGRWTDELNTKENIRLTYCQEDGTMMDDEHEIIHHPVQMVGAEIMDVIDETKNDFLYAIDEKLEKIYEIEIDHDLSYTRDILGCY